LGIVGKGGSEGGKAGKKEEMNSEKDAGNNNMSIQG